MHLIFLLLCAIFLAEICAFLLLKKQSHPTKPILIDFKALKQMRSFRNKVLGQLYKHYMSCDATLGFRLKANATPFRFVDMMKGKKHNEVKQLRLKNLFEISTDNYGFIANHAGQERDYVKIANDPKIYKIVISGNSVSAGSGASCSEANWPSLLEATLNADKKFLGEKYEKVVVINSSNMGYNIAQEMIRFQNETIYLKPDLVISLSGGLANYHYHGNPLDGLHSEQQKKINDHFNINWFFRQNIFLQNIKSYLSLTKRYSEHMRRLYPYRNPAYIKISAAELFVSKVKQFHGLCASHDIDFIFVFQPIMGIGKKTLTEYEEFSKKFFKRYFFWTEWEEYLKMFSKYSEYIRKNLTEKYQYDFMDIFEDVKETVYSDPRHLDDNGNKIIAQAVSEVVAHRTT